MDIEEYTKSTCETLSAGSFNSLFSNPIYVAILITSAVLLIILSIYDEEHLTKTSLYIFLSSLFIVFVHNKLLLIEHRKALCDQDSDNICNIINDSDVVGRGEIVVDNSLPYLNF